MSYFPKTEITYPHGQSELDIAGRLRVSQNHIMFNSHLNYSLLPNSWDQDIVGGGSSVAHLPNESSALLTVGTGSGDKVVRQTKRYWLYRAGQGIQASFTFSGLSQQTDITKQVGYFDDSDGIFLEVTGTDIAIVKRTSISGSPIDIRILQANWNGDKLDGTGPSGVTMDFERAQILVIDLQWFGVGTVRIGFDVGDRVVYAHTFEHANLFYTAYMKRGSLPCRYAIYSTAASAGGTMKQICTSVVREGGSENPGFPGYADMGVTPYTATTTATSVLFLRLKSTHIRAFAQPFHVEVTNLGANPVRYRIIINGTFTGTPTWASVSEAVEASTSNLAYTAGTGVVVSGGYASSTAVSKAVSAQLRPVEAAVGIAASIAGVADIIAIVVETTVGSADVLSTLDFLEFY